MRLITWNCHHGTIERRIEQLRRLDPDLVTLQECCRQGLPFMDAVWSGTREVRGVAVVALNPSLQLEHLNVKLASTAVPVIVHGPTPFVLLAVWAHPTPTYDNFVLNAVRACAKATGDRPMIVMGDLNILPTSDAVRVLREELGVVSAYHHHYRVEPGHEQHPTHFWRWHETSPWHIDFCLVPEAWVGKVRKVCVGGFAEWTDSDHRPLTVELALPFPTLQSSATRAALQPRSTLARCNRAARRAPRRRRSR